ncbi:hypothetical protein CSA17_07110, partial [bacterium DOLJORAL78_65_58]
NACDVFISVPSVDATAVSLLEAMSCGAGIIISSLASSREWIRDGHSGLVVEPRNVSQLTAAMVRFAEDDGFRREAGRRALDTARRFAGFEANMEFVDRIFRGALGAKDAWPQEVSLARLGTGGVG